MSLTLGVGVDIEMTSSNWGPLYFQDIHGLKVSTDGATFLSAYFLLFTVSRLVCGLFVERIGYIRSLLGAAIITLAVFIVGFSLGAKGIYLMPVLGFLVAQFWPILMAVAIVIFGKDAPVYASAMIAISGLLNALIQYVIGLTNKFFGPAWGYRSSVVYTVILIALLLMLYKQFGQQKKPALNNGT
jgi:MFS family permease